MIKVIEENENHKLKDSERQKLLNKYQDQIFLLDQLKKSLSEGKTREDIKYINSMIDYYNQINQEGLKNDSEESASTSDQATFNEDNNQEVD